jgi:uncharacterized protein (DUF305 family)
VITFGAISAMREVAGAEFDRQFLAAMIPHHRGAIRAAGAEAAKGGSPEVKALAQDVVSRQRVELKTMRKLRARI